MYKKNYILAGCLFLAVAVGGSSITQASILEFFFPSLRKVEEDPSDTLQAPFAYDGEANAKVDFMDDRLASEADLSQPHRMIEEISGWLASAISESLTFGGVGYADEISRVSHYFDPHGLKDFEELLQGKGVRRVIESGQYDVRAFVETRPILLNEGVVDGRYRWLFETPVMVTYLRRGTRDYKNNEPINQKMILTVQAGRNASAQNDLGLFIERWSARAAN